MNSTSVASLDHTIQETNIWLKSLNDRMEHGDRHLAYLALRATLHTLRDRIGPENAAHLGAQLPMLIRGLYYEGWHMAGTPTKERHVQHFLNRVRSALGRNPNADPEQMVRAVFSVLSEKIDRGEVEKVINMLPHELRILWPNAEQRSGGALDDSVEHRSARA